jgi:hypothetical protein
VCGPFDRLLGEIDASVDFYGVSSRWRRSRFDRRRGVDVR